MKITTLLTVQNNNQQQIHHPQTQVTPPNNHKLKLTNQNTNPNKQTLWRKSNLTPKPSTNTKTENNTQITPQTHNKYQPTLNTTNKHRIIYRTNK